MSHITKGANTPVPAAPLRVAVGRAAVAGTPAVDASALLLDAAGRVRGDADLVFHNQPAHPSGAVRDGGVGEGGGQFAEWLELDLPSVEPDVRRVVIAGSCDGGTFGQVPGLYVQAITAHGTIVTHYEVTDASTETAFVLGEFYRRDGEWKFRAVGQGYESGLAGLATDFGVAPAAAASSGPVPLTGVAKVGSAPPGAPVGPAGLPAAAEPAAGGLSKARSEAARPAAQAPESAPAQPAAPGESPFHGPGFFDFEPYVVSGAGSDTGVEKVTVTVDIPFPPECAPVIVEAQVAEGRHQSIYVQMPGRSDYVLSHDLPDRRGSTLFVPPRKGGPVRLIVRSNGEWTLTVRPLSTARGIGPGTVQGRGPEVFAYAGDTEAEVKIRVRDREKHWFSLNYHKADESDPLKKDRYLHSGQGRVKKTVRIPEGPLLLVVEHGVNEWDLTLDPLPARTPEPEPKAAAPAPRHAGWTGPRPFHDAETGRRTGVYAGRGTQTVTLVNPRPGRPALVRYAFEGEVKRLMLAVINIDAYGDEDEWLNGVHYGVRGVRMVFPKGKAEQTLRVEHGGEWSLTLLPEEEAPLLTGPTEGQGSTVLRYPGPPTLMTLQRTSTRGKIQPLAADAANHPLGKRASIADTVGRGRPVVGPVWVDSGGTCFVTVTAGEHTTWRLEPVPLDTAPVLGARTEGGWYGVVRHTGPETELSVASTGGETQIYELDENLFPLRKVTGSSGPYRVRRAFLQVRSHGEWVLGLRP
ncbi:TerD family protein [Streptomyces sp. NPDC006458]|uniref:TerD family protein n=1 Tax=Streptomyces sp. NPDC006458 TaxID=3154302 RepID=UPI00339E5112